MYRRKTNRILRNMFFNLQDPEALGRYVRLFDQVLPSLHNINEMEKNITSNTRPNYLKLINTVKRDWVKLRNDIMETKKVSLFSLDPEISRQR